MKRLIKIVSLLLSILLLILLIDLYLLRGYFTSDIVYRIHNGKLAEVNKTKPKDLKLNVLKKDNSYQIQFKNNSYKPYLILTYRWRVIFKVNDSIFFKHLRYKSHFPKYQNNYEYGLDCGTGAGWFSVNPYEAFSIKKSYKELINMIYWSFHHQNMTAHDTVNDLIYKKPLLLIDRDKDFKIFKRNDLSIKDSTDIEFYLPFFNYKRDKIIYVKSNKIRVAYLDIIKNLIEDEKNTHEEFKNF